MNNLFHIHYHLAIRPYVWHFLCCRRSYLSSYYRRPKKLTPNTLKIRVNCPKTYRKKSSIANITFTLSLFIFNKKLTQNICILSIFGLTLLCQKIRDISDRLKFFNIMDQFQFLHDYVALSYISGKETYTVKVFTSTIACLSGKHFASALFIRDSGNEILFRREFEFSSYNDLKNRVEYFLDHFYNYPEE